MGPEEELGQVGVAKKDTPVEPVGVAKISPAQGTDGRGLSKRWFWWVGVAKISHSHVVQEVWLI